MAGTMFAEFVDRNFMNAVSMESGLDGRNNVTKDDLHKELNESQWSPA